MNPNQEPEILQELSKNLKEILVKLKTLQENQIEFQHFKQSADKKSRNNKLLIDLIAYILFFIILIFVVLYYLLTK